jgi:predicted nucleic acid-binding protein
VLRVCLDTSAYSAFKRGHPGVIEELQLAAEIILNPVVLGELLSGFRAGDRYGQNQAELEQFLRSPRVLVLGLDAETALRYSEIVFYLRRQGMPIPTNDVWIAATAMQFGLQVLTTDRHFERLPQVVTRRLPAE